MYDLNVAMRYSEATLIPCRIIGSMIRMWLSSFIIKEVTGIVQ